MLMMGRSLVPPFETSSASREHAGVEDHMPTLARSRRAKSVSLQLFPSHVTRRHPISDRLCSRIESPLLIKHKIEGCAMSKCLQYAIPEDVI